MSNIPVLTSVLQDFMVWHNGLDLPIPPAQEQARG